MTAKDTRPIAKPRGKPFAKGNAGKPRGANAKLPKQLKEMILGALTDAGGQQYLADCARDPKTASAFLTLVGKVLPLQVTGEDGGPLKFARIEAVIVDPRDAQG